MKQSSQQFIEVKSLQEATHWQPEEKLITEDITIGKIYKLGVSTFDGEICIFDDVGMDTLSYLWNKGKLLKLRR